MLTSSHTMSYFSSPKTKPWKNHSISSIFSYLKCVKNLGFIFDRLLSFKDHIKIGSRSSVFSLQPWASLLSFFFESLLKHLSILLLPLVMIIATSFSLVFKPLFYALFNLYNVLLSVFCISLVNFLIYISLLLRDLNAFVSNSALFQNSSYCI